MQSSLERGTKGHIGVRRGVPRGKGKALLEHHYQNKNQETPNNGGENAEYKGRVNGKKRRGSAKTEGGKPWDGIKKTGSGGGGTRKLLSPYWQKFDGGKANCESKGERIAGNSHDKKTGGKKKKSQARAGSR